MDEYHPHIQRLNNDLHSPCYLLNFRDVNILLDCCLDTSTLSYFLPSSQLSDPGCSDLPKFEGQQCDPGIVHIDGMSYLDCGFRFSVMQNAELNSVIWETVDAILISNTRSILGLPFICNNTNFRGKIFATEPVFKFGKLLMDDLLNEVDHLSDNKPDINSVKPQSKDVINQLDNILLSGTYNWNKIYSRESAYKALDRIQLVTYHEPVDLFGLLTVKGLSAGYGIGSCNWIITSSNEKVAYISHSSLLYSHVLPFDDTEFVDTDILIIGTVNMLASNQLERTVEEFQHIVVQTLARGGHVLVPSNPCGIVFDLIETALHAKENFDGTIQPLLPQDQLSSKQINHINNSTDAAGNMNSNLSTDRLQNVSLPAGIGSMSGRVARSPTFLISSQINISLAYANTYGEWLNPEKESLLYTADAPFPYQSLLKSGQLVALKSLHDASSFKNVTHVSAPTPNQMLHSPLLLNPTTTSNNLNSATGLDTTMMTLTNPVEARSLDHCLSGGIWPNQPCLIFASHPSIRLGPVVHLVRALAFGGLRLGNRTSLPSKHSIILIESGDYVPTYHSKSSQPQNPDSAVHHLKRIISPFLNSNNTVLKFTPSGTPVVALSETTVVYWLPMEAGVGPNQLSQIIKRCGEPRLSLILPQELSNCDLNFSNLSDGFLSKVTYLDRGQIHHLNFPTNRLEPVRLSVKLVNHLKPIYIVNNNSKQLSKQQSNATITTGAANRCNISQLIVDVQKADHESVDGGKQKKFDSGTKTDTGDVSGSKRRCIAFVDGLISTHDGKHWLKDATEKHDITKLNSTIKQDFVQPSTPPGNTSKKSKCTDNGDCIVSYKSYDSNNNNLILVNPQSRIDPHQFIQKLTERGVTGAYLADSATTARQLYRRFLCDVNMDHPVHMDIILFPNPNTVVYLADHASHIVTVDESTRSTIRDTLLLFLNRIETYSNLPVK